jgi:hypothetical protein
MPEIEPESASLSPILLLFAIASKEAASVEFGIGLRIRPEPRLSMMSLFSTRALTSVPKPEAMTTPGAPGTTLGWPPVTSLLMKFTFIAGLGLVLFWNRNPASRFCRNVLPVTSALTVAVLPAVIWRPSPLVVLLLSENVEPMTSMLWVPIVLEIAALCSPEPETVVPLIVEVPVTST